MLEAAVWAIARWADTYLLSEEEELSPALQQAFGAAGSGPAVLAALVQLAGSLLTEQGETELHQAVCQRLLPVLVHRRGLCYSLLQLQQWHELAGKHCQTA